MCACVDVFFYLFHSFCGCFGSLQTFYSICGLRVRHSGRLQHWLCPNFEFPFQTIWWLALVRFTVCIQTSKAQIQTFKYTLTFNRKRENPEKKRQTNYKWILLNWYFLFFLYTFFMNTLKVDEVPVKYISESVIDIWFVLKKKKCSRMK